MADLLLPKILTASALDVPLKRKIMPIKDWIRDPYFIGPHAAGQFGGRGMWKFWEEHYEKFFTLRPPKSTLIVTGSTRAGKSFNVYHFLFRYIYEISCFVDFPGLFDLAISSLVLFVTLSTSKGKAKDAGIAKMLRILEEIPYFHHEFPYRLDVTSKIMFNSVEIRPGSTASDLLSEDLFGVIFDEANFTRAKAGQEFEKAKGIFVEARSRGQLTYSKNGISRGFFALISSASTSASFVESMVRDSMADGTGYIIPAAVYKVSPQKFRQDKFFKVFCGIDDVDPHIVDEVLPETVTFIGKTYGMMYEDFLAAHPEAIETVPYDLLPRYQDDIIHALRSASGRPMNMQAAFLKNRKAFDAMFKPELKSPLLMQVPTLSLLSDDIIADFIDVDALLELYELGAPLYVHFDLGLRGDVEGKQGDFAGLGAAFKTEAGRIRVPLYCRIARISSADEIDVSKIEDIVYWLIELGFSIKLVTKDLLARGYFSQNLEKRLGKERVGDLSLDRSDVPFLTFSHLMKKGLLETYVYEPFKQEFPTLIHDRASQKVIKATGGHDDVSQAVIGAVYGCFQGEGMSMESLAVSELLANQQLGAKKEFYEEALAQGAEDDFFSELLNGGEDDLDFDQYAEKLTPDDELQRQMNDRENPRDTYGRRTDNFPRINRDRS